MREFICFFMISILPRVKWADRLRPVLLRWAGARVGRKCALYSPFVLRPIGSARNLILGDKVFINSGARFGCLNTISIADRVRIAANVSFETVGHGLDLDESGRRGTWSKPIVVGQNAWIGAGAVILPGVTLGAGSVVAAGAVVTQDVAPNTLVGGVPARAIRKLNASAVSDSS